VGSRRANAHTPAPDQRCENFLYWYQAPRRRARPN
jgi:hypothetical protein